MREAIIAVMALLIIYAFDRAMQADEDRLCSRDDTAYAECGQ